MAELMDNKGEIVARDVYRHKLRLVEENCARLGVSIVRTEIFDAMVNDQDSIGKYDRVLLDAPCSGFGVIRRKPDLRWKKDPKNFKDLVDMQKRILELASGYVKPGGKLIYSTCTVNRAENLDVVRDFLSSNPQFQMESIIGQVPEKLENDSAHMGYLELYPNVHGTDGFFIAKMEKR